jgi:hypothetical protein
MIMTQNLAVIFDELIKPGGELKITRDDTHPVWSTRPRWTAVIFTPRQDSPYLRPAQTITAHNAVELVQKLEEHL